MDMAYGIAILLGKYLFLGLIYLFLYWAFRGLFAQMTAESQVPRQAAPAPMAAVPLTAVPVAAAPVQQPSAPAQPTVAAPVAPPPPPAPAPPVQPRQATLLVREHGESSLATGQVIDLTAAVTMGRAEDNGVVVNDKFCSTHHALIFLQGGQRVLRDRNSTNGTFHNGRRISEDVVLKDGDRIGLGTIVFEYRAGTQ